MYKWTVNWRFVGEDMFLSKGFAGALLIAHAVLLLLFIFKWCKPYGGVRKVILDGLARHRRGAVSLDPDRK